MTTIGVPRETSPGERRVAVIPGVVPGLTGWDLEVVVEAGAGEGAGFPDEAYAEKGARTGSREDVHRADVVLRVDALADLSQLSARNTVIGFCRPLTEPETVAELAGTGATSFAMELMPRITRAQSMDALSSQATVSGYKAVICVAAALPHLFPLMTTAAGTIKPAKLLVVGTGVAGLQAVATARRLGAVVQAYDVRPAAREQVESLGAKFVELPLEAGEAEDREGYARALDEDFYRRQREMMAGVVAGCDAVITTALVPGMTPPVLVTADMVAGMAAGSVILDLAAEQGGNCELSRPDEDVVHHGVTILGPTNLPATVPADASQMYAKNLVTFLGHLLADGRLTVDMSDEITRETLLTREGEVVHPRLRKTLGLAVEPASAVAGG
ncbi:MAG: Re/Si-specific NAD(P)(+) transhydrogenase subunit alpha [Candidatus Dormibacteria bacterium]